MTEPSNVWLGVIAVSVLVMAVMQVGAVLMLARSVKRFTAIADGLQREITPLAAKVHAIADEAQRAAALATKQVERIDAMVADVARRVQDTTAAVQSVVGAPIRHSTAILAGLRGVIAALLTTRPDRVAHRDEERDEEEDALFVG